MMCCHQARDGSAAARMGTAETIQQLEEELAELQGRCVRVAVVVAWTSGAGRVHPSPRPSLHTRPHIHPHTDTHSYDILLEEARRGLTPAAAAVRFREEDLRALVDAIHRREAQVEKLKRRLRKREQGRGQKAESEGGEREQMMAMGGRLSLLSEIRGVSGLSLYDQTRR